MTRNGGGRRAMEYRNSPGPANIFGITSYLIWIVLQVLITLPVAAQTRVPLQPFAQQVRQVETSLAYLGQPLAQNDADAINQAIGNANEAGAIERLEQILDKYTLAIVDINAESRVKVQPGPAKPELVEAGTRIFLVKVFKSTAVTQDNALPRSVSMSGKARKTSGFAMRWLLSSQLYLHVRCGCSSATRTVHHRWQLSLSATL